MFDRKIKKLSGGGEGKAEANHLTNAFGWIKVAGGSVFAPSPTIGGQATEEGSNPSSSLNSVSLCKS